MRVLTSSELLNLCDLGEAGSPAERAMLLLEAAQGRGADMPRDWPLGNVNRALLQLRTSLFGRHLEVLADCPRCSAICESELDCLDIAATDPATSGLLRLNLDGRQVDFRLPTSADLIAVAQMRGEVCVETLARRILVDGDAAEPNHELVDALAAAIVDADPLAQIELALQCPKCAARWTEPLHVIDLFWAELRHVAAGLIVDVARLARNFGWAEAEILAMSARRRQRYLDLLPA